MTPDFLVDLFGDQQSADTATDVIIVILIIVIPITVPILARLLLRPLKPALKQVTSPELGDRIIDALYVPLEVVVIVASIWAGLTILLSGIDTEAIDEFINIGRALANVATVIVTFSFFWGLFRTINAVAVYSKRWVDDNSSLLNRGMLRFAHQIAQALVLIIGGAVLAAEIGYDLNGVLAGLGLGGLAVALAAQDTLANLIGYFAIMADAPFRVGDFIVINSSEGTVEHIGFRSTRLRQIDQSQIIIPNRTVGNATIKNWSRLSKRRFDMELGLHYNTTREQILSITRDVRDYLEDHERVIHDGSEFSQFVAFGDASITLHFYAYLDITDYERFQAATEGMRLKILDILETHNVKRALPTHAVVMLPEVQAVLSDTPSSE